MIVQYCNMTNCILMLSTAPVLGVAACAIPVRHSIAFVPWAFVASRIALGVVLAAQCDITAVRVKPGNEQAGPRGSF